MSPLSPPLHWAGGKRWLGPRLAALFEPYRKSRLVEPFVGGMAVSLGLQPRSALLADVNKHLIAFYQWLAEGQAASIAMRNDRAAFLRARKRFNRLEQKGWQSAEAAQLFYYLNRTGFNGLCRFNSKGEFNVPFGRYAKINYIKDFAPYRAALKNWQFACRDFEALRLRRTDFLYVDPPYDVEFTKYSKLDFKWEDQVRLVRWLARHRGPIVASNQATPRILRLYREAGFKIRKISAPRLISCNGDRSPALEMLATRNI